MVRAMILVDGSFRWVDAAFLQCLKEAQDLDPIYIAGANRGEEGCVEVVENVVMFTGASLDNPLDKEDVKTSMSRKERVMVKESYPCLPEEVEEMRKEGRD